MELLGRLNSVTFAMGPFPICVFVSGDSIGVIFWPVHFSKVPKGVFAERQVQDWIGLCVMFYSFVEKLTFL